MPEHPMPKPRAHPWVASQHGEPSPEPRSRGDDAHARSKPSGPRFAELAVTNNFTFLRGASHPEEMVERAAALGHGAASIADHDTLAGVVRAHVAAKRIGIPLAVGSRLHLRLDDAGGGRRGGEASHSARRRRMLPVIVYPTSRAAYGRLCRMLSIGKQRASKGACELWLHDLLEHEEGLLAIIMPPNVIDQPVVDAVTGLRGVFDDDRLSLAAARRFDGGDDARLEQIVALGEHARIPLVAVNDVLSHDRGRRALQDVVTCIREGCTLATAGRQLEANGERHLKSPSEMARLFADLPGAVERSAMIAERAAAFSLDELRYEYPHEVCPPGLTPMEHLRSLTWRGARERYPAGVPKRVRTQLEHEFTLIEELAYAPYFLTVHDLVTFARSRDILCQGRGAAANSAVCYCLGVTAVDPGRIDVLFERFVSKERDEPPDIDIDFEHERREEVIQYIYEKYGRDRAALTAEVVTYRGRSAMREVGKAMGFSLDCVDQLAKNVDWWHDGVGSEQSLREIGLDPHERSVRQLLALANEIIGFPRHLSQHVGGFVITQTPLCELVPIEHAAMERRTVIEWDKDDIDAMNMLKVDCLGLGMLTCIRKAMAMVNDWTVPGSQSPSPTGGFENSKATARRDELAAPWPHRPLELHTIPPEDPLVYDMICAADTVGVFQIESRAQMSMLPRLRPRCYYDLVIEVAIVRPGPIQGDMVHPYLRRRNGEEPVEYPSEAVREVLGKTLGVPLFQEQAMSLAVVAAGFSLGDADELRRSMAAWKRKGDQLEKFERKFLAGMLERGYPQEFAERCFRQIRGFSEYGFPESHAASFALLVYASAWLKRHQSAAFAAALINSQPMGFYAPSQIISDAEHHGVTVRAIDVNRSAWDCRLESPHEERLTFERLRQTEMNDAADGAMGGALVDGHGRTTLAGADQPALRLGMRLVKGLRQEDADRIARAVAHNGPFDSLETLWRASGVRLRALRALARADAFQSMGLERQRALWIIRRLRDDGEDRLPIFDQALQRKRNNRHASAERTEGANLPTPGPLKQVRDDYAAMHLSLKAHPMSFLRDELRQRGVTEAVELKDEARWRQGRPIIVAGLVLVRQRPATANGIIFMTLEDETGIANLIVRPQVFERDRRVARHGIAVMAEGWVERQGQVVHVQVKRFHGLDERLASLSARSRNFH